MPTSTRLSRTKGEIRPRSGGQSGVEIVDRRLTNANVGDARLAATIDNLASGDAYTALGFDDLIARLEPMNERSLDRLAMALRLLDRSRAALRRRPMRIDA